jgi:hypothetical protein
LPLDGHRKRWLDRIMKGESRLFRQLDFVYTPSADVAADVRYLTDVLGAELVFAIEDADIRVAMLRLTETPPALVLNDHVEGERPILIYRVGRLRDAVGELSTRGWMSERGVELPIGPARTLKTPGGQRIAIYEATRPK